MKNFLQENVTEADVTGGCTGTNVNTNYNKMIETCLNKSSWFRYIMNPTTKYRSRSDRFEKYSKYKNSVKFNIQ